MKRPDILGVLVLGLGIVALVSHPLVSVAHMETNVSQAGLAHYPDLRTRVPADLVIRIENGRKLLRFSNTVYNWGDGPLELRPKQRPRNQTEAYQRIYSHASDGTPTLFSDTLVGTFVFHRNHHHWHFEGFALYEVLSAGGGLIAVSQKTTVCVRDNPDPEPDPTVTTLPHFAWGDNGRCDKNAIEGLSVGYGDTYPWNIDGQSVDITGLSDGCYVFRSTANPNRTIIESDYDNNSAAVTFSLSGTTVSVNDPNCGA